jgi:hypothetical protein
MDRKSLQSAYREHLKCKSESWGELLNDLEYSDPMAGNIQPTNLSRGFRSRMKFKIFRRSGLRAMGTHPLLGERPAQECLWALPFWGREPAGSLLSMILRKDEDFPVDGIELLLSHGREQMCALLSVSRKIKRSYRNYAANLIVENPGLIGVAVPSQKVSVGQSALNHRILGFDLTAHLGTFFQSNQQLIPEIVTFVRSLCSESAAGRLLDLYCGAGLHSVFSGRNYGCVWGVEYSPSAIRDARENARAAGLKNSRFFQATVESFISKYKIRPSDCVILNPPRSGIGKDIILRLTLGKPTRIITVSCNPETQSRDLHAFKNYGYSIQKIAAFDMFPFSPFLETAALLVPKS